MDNMKQVIRLTESDLHRLVKESVQQILREMDGGAGMGVGFDGGNSTGGNGANNTAGLNRGTSDVSGGIQKPAKGLVKPDDETLKRNEDYKNGSISMRHLE